MTSKFKALTDNTPPSSYGGGIEGKGRQSAQLAGMTTVGASTRSMTITPKQSETTLTTGKSVSEKSRLAAQVLKAVLSRLEKDGLIKRFRVLSADRTTVKEIRITFDNSLWTDTLDLRVLSGETTHHIAEYKFCSCAMPKPRWKESSAWYCDDCKKPIWEGI